MTQPARFHNIRFFSLTFHICSYTSAEPRGELRPLPFPMASPLPAPPSIRRTPPFAAQETHALPFNATSLVLLIQTPPFSLWHYRSADLQSAIVAAGYFGPAAAQLRPGDVMIVQSADSMTILPVRSNALVGPGVALDGAVTPIALTRSVPQTLRMVQVAGAIVSTIILAPLMAGIIIGTSIPVQAQIIGPIQQVVVTLRDAQNQLIPPAQTLNVDQGYITTTLPTPAIGGGYRIRVEDALETGVVATSRSFNILPDLRLMLTEDGAILVQEDGAALVQG